MEEMIDSYYGSIDESDDMSQEADNSNSDSQCDQDDGIPIDYDDYINIVKNNNEYKAYKILKELELGYNSETKKNYRKIVIPLEFDGLEAYCYLGFDMTDAMREMDKNKGRSPKDLIYIVIEFIWNEMSEDMWLTRYNGRAYLESDYDMIKEALEILFYENVKVYLVNKENGNTAISTFV